MVSPDSYRISRARHYLGSFLSSGAFRLQDCHLLRYPFPEISPKRLPSEWVGAATPRTSPYPENATPARLTRLRFGLQRFRSPLLTLSLRFLFLRLLRCFTSPGSPPFRDDEPLCSPGFPIRVPTALRSLAPYRGFSQLAAPFFASYVLGIHRMPFFP